MERLLAAVGLVLTLAACAADADSAQAPEVDCRPGDLGCAVVTDAEVLALVGEGVEITSTQVADFEPVTSWCDTPVPSPRERHHLTHTVRAREQGPVMFVGSSVLDYVENDAIALLDAVASLDPGCSWTEGQVEFLVLSPIDLGVRGDQTAGLLVRVDTGEAIDNVSLAWVRNGGTVAQLSVVPEQAETRFLAALVARAELRLEAVVPS